jgi:hypothetical protein
MRDDMGLTNPAASNTRSDMNLSAMIEAVAEQAIWSGLVAGIYGEGHWRRTFKLAEMLMQKTPRAHKHIVGLACLCHDIGRLNHMSDRNHGYRGASIAMRIAANLFAQHPMGGNEFYGAMVTIGKVSDIVSRHCLNHRPDYLEFQIVHDANILDRVRFEGRASIDVKKFSIPKISIPLIDAALELLESEPEDDEKPGVIQIEKKLIVPKGRM